MRKRSQNQEPISCPERLSIYNMKDFGKRLSTIRIKRYEMTQKEFATYLDISQEYLSKLERGMRNPSVDVIVESAARLNVPIDFLLTGNDYGVVESHAKILAMIEQLTAIEKSVSTYVAEIKCCSGKR